MKMNLLRSSAFLWVVGIVAFRGEQAALAAFPDLFLRPLVMQQLHSPTCITHAPDGSGRLFVCDQAGQIRIIDGGMLVTTPFLDISSSAAVVAHRKVLAVGTGYTERGLLSLAFHPGYADPMSQGYRKFYVNYNKDYQAGIDPPPHLGGTWTPNSTTVIAEFQVSATNPNVADPLSERKLLLYPQPQFNHNGGSMVFDNAGFLYIGSGDGGNSNDNGNGHTGGTANDALGNGQDKTVFLGKILRINPVDPDGAGPLTYSIPPGNPFVGVGGGVKEEIYAFGIRNPWGLAFDNGPGGTGRLFCADVGQGRIEEVNLIVNGGNYGWRYMEGMERPTFSSTMAHPGGTLIGPIAQYGHPGTSGTGLPLLGLSITGGVVYRGSAIPALQGKYVFGDYGSTSGSPSGRMMGLEETSPSSGVFTLTEALPILGGNPLSYRIMCLGCDASGEIYVGTKSSGGVLALENGLPNGGIYKIVVAPASPAPVMLTAIKDNSLFSEGELSNGAGPLFAGTGSAGDIRRALMQFDLTSLPSDSRFNTAMLQIHVNSAETANAQRNTFVNRLTSAWGEAASFSSTGGAAAQTGDATWMNRLYSPTTPTAWTNEGGDFSSTLSASFGLNAQTGFRGFQGPQLVNDVHSWLTSPAQNLGWLLRSDEGANSTTKQIASREDVDAAKRPTLILVHATPFERWISTYFPSHLPGQWVDPRGDLDGDGIANQIEYAYGYSPTSYNAVNGLGSSIAPVVGMNRETTTTFLRDTSATDLTYRLEISADLLAWTVIARSVAGAATVGENGGSVSGESTVSGTIKEVSVTRTLTGSDTDRHFVRLVVERSL